MDVDAVEECAALMKNDVFPILQKEMEREKYNEVVHKCDMLENELHMLEACCAHLAGCAAAWWRNHAAWWRNHGFLARRPHRIVGFH